MSEINDVPSAPLVGIGHFATLAEARESALGLAARGLLYEIDAVGAGWVLLVEETQAEIALQELSALEQEAPADLPAEEEAPPESLDWRPLVVPALVMTLLFHIQSWVSGWTEAGLADSRAILAGSWWRALTALTLHADFGHFLANLWTGLLFTAFLQMRLGPGVSWLLILASGTLGNLINAWGYRHEAHLSLGASTAVFGALGLLVAEESWARWRSPATRHHRHLIIPIGAGLALLAFLGVGDGHDRVDFMAHGWGFLSGLVLGSGVGVVTTGHPPSSYWQWAAVEITLVSLIIAWASAMSATA